VAADDLGGYRTNAIFFVTTNAPGGTFLITNGSTWNYLVTGNDPGATWREPTFDDSGWSNGLAEVGYGDRDPPDSRPERSVISAVPSLGAATYFRKSFPVRDRGDFTNLVVHLLRDAGGVVYLNGVEVCRDNMPTGAVAHTTLAASEPFDDGTRYVSTNVSPALLVTGDNVIAVEIHPFLPVLYETADLSFDLMLWGQPGEPALTITRISATELDIAGPFPSTGYSLESKPYLGAPK
jgi:hypothetical protein